MKSHKKLSMKKRKTALFRSVFRSRTSFASCVLSESIGYKYLSTNFRQNWASTESRTRTGPVPRSRSVTQNGLTKSSFMTLLSDLLRATDRPTTYEKQTSSQHSVSHMPTVRSYVHTHTHTHIYIYIVHKVGQKPDCFDVNNFIQLDETRWASVDGASACYNFDL